MKDTTTLSTNELPPIVYLPDPEVYERVLALEDTIQRLKRNNKAKTRHLEGSVRREREARELLRAKVEECEVLRMHLEYRPRGGLWARLMRLFT